MVSTSKGRDMTRGPEWRCLLAFALPIMAGQLLQQLYNTVDGIVVGNYVSSDALGAVGTCGTVAFLFLAFCVGMSTGSGVVIAQLFGARREEDMRRTASTALIMQTALGVALSALGAACAGPIMGGLMGIEDPEVRAQAVGYFRIYALGLGFQFVYNAVAATLRSVGDSKASLYFLIVSTVVNAALDLVFVAVLHWGVEGAAAATVIAQLACAAVSYAYMQKNYPVFRFRLREYVFDRQKFRLCLRLSLPTAVQHLIVSGGNMLVQRLVISFGSDTMAAFTVGSRIDNYVTVPIMGFHSATASFAGQNIGAGRMDRVTRGLRSAMAMSFGFVFALGAVLYALAPQLSRFFGVEGEALRQSVECIHFLLPCLLIFAMYQPFVGLFQGAGDPGFCMFISLTALGGKVIGAYAMARVFMLGYSSCWRSSLIGWSCALALSLFHYAFGRWRDKAIVRPAAPEENK